MILRDWARRLIDGIPAAVREDLASRPAAAMQLHFGLTVRASSVLGQRGDGGWCDGLSFTDQDEVLYAPSPYSKRENFTLLHELGHRLVAVDDDVDTLDWLGELEDEALTVEQVCDVIAGELLLPSAMVDVALEGGAPSGSALVRLHARSNASREACAVALAQRLGCVGFVTVARDDVTTFTARLGEPHPAPWRGNSLPSGHPMRSISDGQVQVTESWWPTRAGRRERYYQHATRHGPWTYGVFATNDLWGVTKLHLPAEEVRPRPERRHMRCPSCGYSGPVRSFSCNSCHQPTCPRCDTCDCDRRAARPRGTCRRCFVSVLPHLLKDGLCDNCR